jgi:hypothetical protein
MVTFAFHVFHCFGWSCVGERDFQTLGGVFSSGTLRWTGLGDGKANVIYVDAHDVTLVMEWLRPWLRL